MSTFSIELTLFLEQHHLESLSSECKENDETVLHLLAEAGRVDLLDEAVVKLKRVDFLDKHGRTPLYYAIRAQQTAALQRLIELKSDVNHQDKNYLTPLHYANNLLANEEIPPSTANNIKNIIDFLYANGGKIYLPRRTLWNLMETLDITKRKFIEQLDKQFNSTAEQIKTIDLDSENNDNQFYAHWQGKLTSCLDITQRYIAEANKHQIDFLKKVQTTTINTFATMGYTLANDFLKGLELFNQGLSSECYFKIGGPLFAWVLLKILESDKNIYYEDFAKVVIMQNGALPAAIKEADFTNDINFTNQRMQHHFFGKLRKKLEPMLKEHIELYNHFFAERSNPQVSMEQADQISAKMTRFQSFFVEHFNNFMKTFQIQMREKLQQATPFEALQIIAFFEHEIHEITESQNSDLASITNSSTKLHGIIRNANLPSVFAVQLAQAVTISVSLLSHYVQNSYISNISKKVDAILQFCQNFPPQLRSSKRYQDKFKQILVDLESIKKSDAKKQKEIEQQKRTTNAMLRDQEIAKERLAAEKKLAACQLQSTLNAQRAQLIENINNNLNPADHDILCLILQKGKHNDIPETSLLNLFRSPSGFDKLLPFKVKKKDKGYQLFFDNKAITTIHFQHGKTEKTLNEKAFNKIREQFEKLEITLKTLGPKPSIKSNSMHARSKS